MPNTAKTQLYNAELKKLALNPVGINKSICFTHKAEGFNASCGDEITIHLELDHTSRTIKDISFETESCAICRASASLLCQSAVGLSIDMVNNVIMQLQNHLRKTTSNTSMELTKMDLPKVNFEILSPVSQFPSRINCALLPWETLEEACQGSNLKEL